jgi:stearoyl-CoA desaturase (delta-9 desaturase)
MGEGWHNNHHAYQTSARQGFRWWEIDVTYYLLSLLSKVGIVWALRIPPQQILENNYRLGTKVINKIAADLANRRDAATIAAALKSYLPKEELTRLRARICEGHPGLAIMSKKTLFPHLPTRDHLLCDARTLLAKTHCPPGAVEEIGNRAYQLLLAAVGSRLVAQANARGC